MNEIALQGREFALTDAEFARIQRLLKERSGIDVGAGKRMLVYGRLTRRLRALKLARFADYLQLIDDPESEESRAFLNALTTNVTELFREEHHFEMLRSRIAPELVAAGAKRLRIWSAGCSAGDEPYSIALTLARLPSLSDCDVKILATDIDSDILAQAKAGVYPIEKVAALKAEYRSYFSRGIGKQEGLARVNERLKNMITFKELNLHGAWPMQGPFDVIFCRNVVIYFDAPTRERLVRRFVSLLRPGGYLFMGHSESPSVSSIAGLRSCGRTAFIKLSGERDE
jgi:chemotaxis protein methyltransferase CheR